MQRWKSPGGKPRALAFSPDGKTLATAGARGKFVWLWDPTTGEQKAKLAGHEGAVVDLAYRPDGQHLASIDNAGRVLVWPAEGGNPVAGLQPTARAAAHLAFAPQADRLVVAGPKALNWWDAPAQPGEGGPRPPSGTKEGAWQKTAIELIRFTPDGEHLLIGTSELAVWASDLSRCVMRKRITTSAAARVLAVSRDGKLAALVVRNRIHIYDLQDWQKEQHLAWGSADNIFHAGAFTPDGAALLLAGNDGKIRCYNTSTWKVTEEDFGTDIVRVLDVAADGRAVVGGDTGELVVWDLA